MGTPAQQPKTITFPVENLGTGDTIQMIFSFEVYHSDSYAPDIVAADYDMMVSNYGTLEMDYDLEDRLLTPSELSFEIVDPQGVLDTYLFESQIVVLSGDNRFIVELKLNGVTEFIGAVLEDSIFLDVGKKTIKFKAAPRIDVINNQMVYDADNVAINPFGYTSNARYLIRTFLEDVYKQVDPAMTLDITHSWGFEGFDLDTYLIYHNDFVLDGAANRSLTLHAHLLYFDNYVSVQNTGDVLRELAKAFGAYTGMIHEKKAFFKELFVYNSANTQTLGTVLTHEKNYKYSLIDWVRIEHYTSSQVYTAGEITNIEGRYIEDTSIPRSSSAAGYATLFVDRDGVDYQISSALCSRVNAAWIDLGQLLAEFWYKYRSDIQYLRVDRFEVVGVNYDFLKDFTYSGYKYQIMNMKKKYKDGITEIEALSLGAV